MAVSGLVPRRGAARLKVSGTLDGTLVFTRDGRVRGRLGGHPVGGRAALTRETVGQRLERLRSVRFP